MFQEMFVAFDEAEEAVGAEGLHQTLHGAETQLEIEIAVDCDAVFDLTAAIVCRQLCAFAFGKIDIRIIKQRREIVFGKAGSHSLKIDQVRLTVSDDDVLRLKVAVHQNSRE